MRPSPAALVATIALVLALSGAASALPGKRSVSTNDIKPGAITKKLIAKGAVGSAQIEGKSIKGNRLKDGAVKNKQIADATITSEQVAPDGLNSSNIADFKALGPVRVTATAGADEASARAAAPKTELFKKSQLTITAKCFRSAATDTVFAEVYVETSANGAIFNGETDLKVGGNAAADFLNTTTPEVDRQLEQQAATGAAAAYNEGEFTVTSADGKLQLIGQTSTAAKSGELAGGNGVYGAGNVCLIGGEIAG
jgi:hypothetical protein